jgi:hypothetical protein
LGWFFLLVLLLLPTALSGSALPHSWRKLFSKRQTHHWEALAESDDRLRGVLTLVRAHSGVIFIDRFPGDCRSGQQSQHEKCEKSDWRLHGEVWLVFAAGRFGLLLGVVEDTDGKSCFTTDVLGCRLACDGLCHCCASKAFWLER